jgi:hypothetical protein
MHRGRNMKGMSFGYVVAIVLAVAPSAASAKSCGEIAARCLKKAIDIGYDEYEWKKKCYDRQIMIVCNHANSLKYQEPSGGRILIPGGGRFWLLDEK